MRSASLSHPWRHCQRPLSIEHLTQHVGAVGEQAVDTQVEQLSHLLGVVDRPDVDVPARGVSTAYESGRDQRDAPVPVRHLEGDTAASEQISGRALGRQPEAATSHGAAAVATRPPVQPAEGADDGLVEGADQHPVVGVELLDEVGQRLVRAPAT